MNQKSTESKAVLETERLTLHYLTLDDTPFILQLVNEPSFLRHIGDKGVRDLAGARAYLEDGPLASYERFGFGIFRVDLKDGTGSSSGTPIGTCGLLQRDYLEDVDIGFAFLSAYWGHGYAFESAAAVLTWGQESQGIERIVAIVSKDNEPSKSLLEKLGLSCEKTIRLLNEDDDVELFTPKRSSSR